MGNHVLDGCNRALRTSRFAEQCCIFLLCFCALRIRCSLAHLTTVQEAFSKCEISLAKETKGTKQKIEQNKK